MDQPVVNKIRITSEMIEDWTVEAISLYESGQDIRSINQYLQEQGCTPLIRQRIIQKAKNEVKTEHRGKGLRSLLLGLAMLGGSAYFYHTLGTSGAHLHGRGALKGLLAVAMLGLIGFALTVLGAIKFLSGNTMDIDIDDA